MNLKKMIKKYNILLENIYMNENKFLIEEIVILKYINI